MKQRLYITTPIYYVNDSPHIGHAYTTIACDIMARYYALNDQSVFFLTGTDEHGQKVSKAANFKKIDPQTFTDHVSKRFLALVKGGNNLLNVCNHDFIRTTESRHIKSAQAFWCQILKEHPDAIYKDHYRGWYSVRDEAYYQESELASKGDHFIAPSGAEVEWVEEDSYFFRLSAFQERLIDFYNNNPEWIKPLSRFNEVKRFVESGLKDLSISRTTFSWGVPVPNDTAHVMYVWIDALTNYLTALGYPDKTTENYRLYWQSEESRKIHVVGKDILRFHAVYWPAFLMAANLPLPDQIIAHGWWKIEGEKMSKSLGNVIAPTEMIDDLGLDQARYVLFREVPFGNDGNFSVKSLSLRINAELANNFGNLLQRSLSMAFKECHQSLPSLKKVDTDAPYHHFNLSLYSTHMECFCFDKAISLVMDMLRLCNEFIDKEAPWTMKKNQEINAMESVLFIVLECCKRAAILLLPIMPKNCNDILDQLCVAPNHRKLTQLTRPLQSGAKISKPVPVFPRIDLKGGF